MSVRYDQVFNNDKHCAHACPNDKAPLRLRKTGRIAAVVRTAESRLQSRASLAIRFRQRRIARSSPRPRPKAEGF